MNDTITAIGAALRTALTWELNGLLVLVYTAWAHVALLVTAAACGWLLWGLPEGRRESGASQRPWLLGTGVLACLAAALAPAPVPLLLAAMTLAGSLAVRADRFNPAVLAALRDEALLNLLLYTGLRVGEAAALRLDDVVLNGKAAKAIVRSGKGMKYREVPLHREARQALAAYLKVRPQAEDDHLFLGQRGPLGVRGIQLQLAALGEAAGVTVPPAFA